MRGWVALFVAGLLAFAVLAVPGAPSAALAGGLQQTAQAPVPAPALIQQGPYRYFPETGHFLRGVFLRYWESHGATEILGLPLTEPFMENGLAVQYLERARMEWHPEISEGEQQGRILLGRLGALLARDRITGRTSPSGTGSVYFPETGHNLSGVFLAYWRSNGGLPVFGYPLSEEQQETNPADGRQYLVQYFERNRFELHPERDAAHRVQLGLLGVEYARANHLNPLVRILVPEPVQLGTDAINAAKLSRLVDPDLMPAVQALGRTPQFRWVPALIASSNVTVLFADVDEGGLAGAFAVTQRPNRPLAIVVSESARGDRVEVHASIIAHEATHAYDYTTGIIQGRLTCSIEEESRAYMNGLAAWLLLRGSGALGARYSPGSPEDEVNNSLRGYNGGKERLELNFSVEQGRDYLRTLYGAGCGA
jgi:hypothetical protein